MVLVKVREAVVKKYWWIHVVRDGEVQGALYGWDYYARCVGIADVLSRPGRRITLEGIAGVLLEVQGDEI